MNELKTLKDIKINYCANPLFFFGADDQYNRIRREAIKWIIDIRNNLDDNVPSGCKDTIGLICWIKHFFNITEEDLDDEK